MTGIQRREPLVEPEPEVAALPHQRADGQHRRDRVAQDQADRLEPRHASVEGRVGGKDGEERVGQAGQRHAEQHREGKQRAAHPAGTRYSNSLMPAPAMKPPSISASSQACGSSGRCSSTTRVTSRNGSGYSARTCCTSCISAPGLAQAAVCGDGGKSFRAISVTATSRNDAVALDLQPDDLAGTAVAAQIQERLVPVEGLPVERAHTVARPASRPAPPVRWA